MLLLLLAIGCGPSSAPPATEPTTTEPAPTVPAPAPMPVPTTPPPGCEGDDGGPVTLRIHPYLQQVTPTSAWVMWETDAGVGSRVDFGQSTLDQLACGVRVPSFPDGDPDEAETQVHATQLTGLLPDTSYAYRVRTGDTSSAEHRFRTAPLPDAEAAFHLVAMSDSQLDAAHPEVFRELIDDGVLPVLAAEGDAAFVLFPGDLVDNGWFIDEWRDEFFAPGAALWATTPVYPAIGNHEGGSPLYFRYFHLPEEADLGEHAYHLDYSNLRVVALDSNGFRPDEQLLWLDEQLADACTHPQVDFVFAQLHHPMLSELWTPGESDFTADVVARLEAFSTACGKPSIHFFGHTHGYSRGQSRDHQHLMVNVASAGGALDRWGEQPQVDYEPFTVSQDTYGFVTVHVEAGDAPRFQLTRYSRGTPEAPLANVVSDQVTVLRDNEPPEAPEPLPLGCPPTLAIDGFTDPEGHGHQATHWQVDLDGSFTAPLLDRWRQARNEFMGVDTQADDDLLDEALDELPPGTTDITWRVRVRDEHLAWSDWSTPRQEAVPSCP